MGMDARPRCLQQVILKSNMPDYMFTLLHNSLAWTSVQLIHFAFRNREVRNPPRFDVNVTSDKMKRFSIRHGLLIWFPLVFQRV